MRECEIIERIKAICESRSWSYYRLAKESGIAYSTLCTMLHKTNCPSIPTLIRICDGFGITLVQFFDTDDERVLLSSSQVKHLDMWNRLSNENKAVAENYIEFLLSSQNEMS